MEKRKIPVFYHIPKNAGTYVSDWFLIAFRYYRRTYTDWLKNQTSKNDTIKSIQIVENEFIIARVLVGDSEYFCEKFSHFIEKRSGTEWDIEFKNVTLDFIKNLFIFGIIIESHGFKKRYSVLNLFKNYDLHEFLILRDSFSRAKSIYNYNKSEESKHDYSHGLVQATTLEEYILSNQLEDSWLIRNLTEIEDSVALGEGSFNKAVNALTNVKVYDIKYTDKAIQEAFLNCYNFDSQQIKLNSWDKVTKNETFDKKIKFEELPKNTQLVFLERTYWDNKLYNTLLNI